MDLAAQIETFLLANPRWVPVDEICARFDVNERQLRAVGGRPPMHAAFAISSPAPGHHGLKHIRHATITERLAHKHRCKRNLIAYARAVKAYNLALAHAIDRRAPMPTDATGHGVLSL